MALITIKEFAENNNVSRQTIEYLVKSGKLKHQLKFGKILISDKAIYTPVRNSKKEA